MEQNTTSYLFPCISFTIIHLLLWHTIDFCTCSVRCTPTTRQGLEWVTSLPSPLMSRYLSRMNNTVHPGSFQILGSHLSPLSSPKILKILWTSKPLSHCLHGSPGLNGLISLFQWLILSSLKISSPPSYPWDMRLGLQIFSTVPRVILTHSHNNRFNVSSLSVPTVTTFISSLAPNKHPIAVPEFLFAEGMNK